MFPTEAVPERIGAYKVLRRMAGVGSADVYVGRMEGPRGFSRLCTLKLVPNTAEGDERFADELEREAAICATLNHPAIQRMFDFFEHETHLVLVLEHVEGTSLDRLLSNLVRRQKKLSDAAIAAIGRELAGALAHAHALKDDDRKPTPVIHRNLSPENVLIGWDGQVRLTGFGLGKILGRTPDTVIGVIKGAPGFMAPEQLRGERVTPKADVYALGLLLWSLFTGQKPPDDGTRTPRLATTRPDLSKPVALAIDRALEQAPDKRGVSCQELEAILGKMPGIEKGREELAEKALLLKGQRTTTTDPEVRAKPTGPARTATPRPRRKVALDQVRPGKPVASSKQKLSVPPPASRPSQRPSQRPTPPSGILDEEGPQSVYPLLRALAERVPKQGGDIPGPPRLPGAGAPPPDKPKLPPPLPAAGKEAPKKKPVAPLGLGSTQDEWMESVPDEVALDRFFDEATSRHGYELEALGVTDEVREANKDEAKDKPKPQTTPSPAAGAGKPAPPQTMELADTVQGMPVIPEEDLPAQNTRTEPTAQRPKVELLATKTDPSPQPPKAVRFGAPPPQVGQGLSATPTPPPLGPPMPVRFGPPPASVAMLAPPAAPMPPVGAISAAKPKRKRSKTNGAAIAVVGGVACMVAAAVVMLVGPPSSDVTPAASASVAAPPPPPPPTPSVTAPATQEPAPLPPPPAGAGYLTVEFPGEGYVYLSGKRLGKTNEPLLVPCGRKFIRVSSTDEGRYPTWLSPGETVDVACQGTTKFSTSPGAPAPLPPKKKKR